MISSLVVIANEEFENEIKNIKDANIEQVIDKKFIVLIEASDFDNTLATFNAIKRLDSVIDVNMAFSEASEFDLEINAQKIADKVNALGNAENIEYYGNIYNKY
ncbi:MULTISPECIES: chaperone NapD [unclassified Campylobacter]|uniref:chaperone NapD n=1 Tax=unclassified Campylobacter TaxID=2593542 RepID=UPI001BDA45C8|nr:MULTISPECIES: chaperone NapD [unclassified Campylobacter]MBZ7976759.1 chaperone NapD [Campylobacter sp. RM12637]MBZ7978413.1 chaperone NapD [Campylobacter sp. RM12654]MBZ7980481.1 chaperone NapD [Campylobacter sp. RM12642]MBZ7982273.1 chaperone NapD [Campylobacter sp. RM12640]MBZ7984162.1 chaperone NapD [Campylobacter sp. RM12647]MBZ7989461.1 chaperone NapD [Campylobacter sp. RM12635]MBZ7991709.1 chaperone NapD [Campylobacter sp. RM9331]MBZ7993433.1 chaperone NapD [Campylobacter sp. RM93